VAARRGGRIHHARYPIDEDVSQHLIMIGRQLATGGDKSGDLVPELCAWYRHTWFSLAVSTVHLAPSKGNGVFPAEQAAEIGVLLRGR
jgi:hypothetical protein